MGKLNLLKASYQGKVGETVGQKWKDRTNICSYTKHGDAKTPAQIIQRSRHKIMVQVLSAYYQKCPELLSLSSRKSTKFQNFQVLNRSFINQDWSLNLPLKGFIPDSWVQGGATLNSNNNGYELSYSGYVHRPEHTTIADPMLILRNTENNEVRVLKGGNSTWYLQTTSEKTAQFSVQGLVLVASSPNPEYATYSWWYRDPQIIELPTTWIDGIVES